MIDYMQSVNIFKISFALFLVLNSYFAGIVNVCFNNLGGIDFFIVMFAHLLLPV